MSKKKSVELESPAEPELVEGDKEPSGALAPEPSAGDSSVREFVGIDGRKYRRVHVRVGGGWKDFSEPADN